LLPAVDLDHMQGVVILVIFRLEVVLVAYVTPKIKKDFFRSLGLHIVGTYGFKQIPTQSSVLMTTFARFVCDA